MILFHHIPKTGGSSLIELFKRALGEECIHVVPTPASYEEPFVLEPTDKPIVVTHLPYDVVEPAYPDRRHITILRDPIDRVRSYIAHRRNGDKDAPILSMTDKDFFTSNLRVARINMVNGMTRQLGGNNYDAAEIKDSRYLAECLFKARQRVESMAWVGFTDTLDSDILKLCDMVGVSASLPHSNAAKINVKFDKVTENIVRINNEVDYELIGSVKP